MTSCLHGILENETVTEIIYDIILFMFWSRFRPVVYETETMTSCLRGILENETVTKVICDIMLFTFRIGIVYYVQKMRVL